ncbi:BA14K family protein [Pseudorhodoplanes sp.]|uniref:BA14K family protein n=1 Tax=Pseudorhodoplanes sp. TaxID=1934341 RepID=UPI002D1B5EE3|nr:BA14K family protein [Pseudorhodoplanes sp.]HWV41999.1 BA14K family protein [Pseudorhodoplanes sp.]
MSLSKLLSVSAGLSALALAAFLAPSAASAAPAATGLSALGAPDRQLVQDVRWRGRPYYGYHRHYGRDAAIAGGIIGGLALGAAIAGAASAPPPPPGYAPAPGYAPPPPDWIAYCASKYKSFNPATGLYLGYDGQYHPCQ